MRILEVLYVGGFVDYAFVSESCPMLQGDSGVTPSCSGHDVRVGLDLQVHPFPRRGVNPWMASVSVASGSRSRTSVASAAAASGGSTSVTLSGWDVIDVGLGLDVRAMPGLGIGPYVDFASGAFSSASSTSTGSAPSAVAGDIVNTSTHQWFTVGLRGTLGIGVPEN